MSFTQLFKPFYYIVDKSHTYMVSEISYHNNASTIERVHLKLIQDTYQFTAEYKCKWKDEPQNIENIRNINLQLKQFDNKPIFYKIDKEKCQLTLAGFEIVKVIPNIICESETEENIEQFYKAAISKRIKQKRCRFNKIIKQLDLNKLSNDHLHTLEQAIKYMV